MEKAGQTVDASAMETPASSSGLGATLLRVAWLAILLGLAMEGVLLVLAAGLTNIPEAKVVARDLVEKVSWSFVVCTGLAVGTAVPAGKGREGAMGLAGLLAAPLAFTIARTLHRGVGEALDLAAAGASSPSPFFLALIKAVEYGFLGAALGWLGRRPSAGVGSHIAVGLAAGVVFGGAIVTLAAWAIPQPPAASLLSTGVNELLFPVGCALAIFVAEALGKRLG